MALMSVLSIYLLALSVEPEVHTLGVIRGPQGWGLQLWEGIDNNEYVITSSNDPNGTTERTSGTVFNLDGLKVKVSDIEIARSNHVSGITMHSINSLVTCWVEPGSSSTGDEGVLIKTLDGNLAQTETKAFRADSWRSTILESNVLVPTYSDTTPSVHIVTQDVGSGGALQLESSTAPAYNTTTIYTFPTLNLPEPLREAGNPWTVRTSRFVHVFYEGVNTESGLVSVARGTWVMPLSSPRVALTNLPPLHPKEPVVEADGRILSVKTIGIATLILTKSSNDDVTLRVISEFGDILSTVPIFCDPNSTCTDQKLFTFEEGVYLFSTVYPNSTQPESFLMLTRYTLLINAFAHDIFGSDVVVVVKEFNETNGVMGAYDVIMERGSTPGTSCLVAVQVGDTETEIIKVSWEFDPTQAPRTFPPTIVPPPRTPSPGVTMSPSIDNSSASSSSSESQSESSSSESSSDSTLERDIHNKAVMIAAAVIIIISMGVCIYLHLQWRYKQAVDEASKILIDFEHELDNL